MENRITIEGFHAFKHAARFGAEFESIFTNDKKELEQLCRELAPDLVSFLGQATEVSNEEFAKLSEIDMRTPLVATAKKPDQKPRITGRSLFLERPRSLENIGAIVRLAAGMGLDAVYTSGEHDPWQKTAVRTAQGLQFAIPAISVESANKLPGLPIYVFAEDGEDIRAVDIPENCILAFGSERWGATDGLKEQAVQLVRLPIRKGVSSYNLATSVALSLGYTIRS